MAAKTMNQLATISGMANSDLLLVYDISEGGSEKTKSILYSDFSLGLSGGSYIPVDGTTDMAMAPGSDWAIKDTDGDVLANFTSNGAVELYYNNALAFSTITDTDNGIAVHGVDGDHTMLMYFNGYNFTFANRNADAEKSTMYFHVDDATGADSIGLKIDGGAGVTSYYDGDIAFTVIGSGWTSVGGGADFSLRYDTSYWRLTSSVHGAPVYIQAENASGSRKSIVGGDPDGAASMYYTGTKTFETTAAGANISDGTDTAELAYNSGSFIIKNTNHGGQVILRGENNSGTQTEILVGDPDGASQLYYANVATLQTDDEGIQIGDGTNKFYLRYNSGYNEIYTLVHGSPFRIIGENNAGTWKNQLVCDPDGAAELYYAGTKTFETQSAGVNITDGTDTAQIYYGSGNLFINNTNHGGVTYLRGENSSGAIKTLLTGDADHNLQLYFAGTKVFSTTGGGVSIFDDSGTEPRGHFISSVGTVQGYIQFDNTGGFTAYDEVNDGNILASVGGGATELYYAGDKKFETTASGVAVTGGIFVSDMKSGDTQVNAGAAVDELWRTASHATLPDGVVMIGI